MKLEGCDFFACVTPFPNFAADGLCRKNPDGTDTMIINANLPVERWAEIYEHERAHLEHDDLYHSGCVAEMESRTEGESDGK